MQRYGRVWFPSLAAFQVHKTIVLTLATELKQPNSFCSLIQFESSITRTHKHSCMSRTIRPEHRATVTNLFFLTISVDRKCIFVTHEMFISKIYRVNNFTRQFQRSCPEIPLASLYCNLERRKFLSTRGTCLILRGTLQNQVSI